MRPLLASALLLSIVASVFVAVPSKAATTKALVVSTSAAKNVTTTPVDPTNKTLSHIDDLPHLRNKDKLMTVKSGAMGLLIIVGAVVVLYIGFSSWRSSQRKNRLRTYRGAREKMELAPLGKNADDQEDDTIFDMAKA